MPGAVARDKWRKFVNAAPKYSTLGDADPLQAWALDQVQGFDALSRTAVRAGWGPFWQRRRSPRGAAMRRNRATVPRRPYKQTLSNGSNPLKPTDA